MRYIYFLVATLILTSIGMSATYYVPDNYATIQAAIEVSSNGDVIIVRPGTYVENIDFVGKAITVKSEQGASVTKIDGNQLDAVVIFSPGGGLDSILEGFTVTNGDGHFGGGIACSISGATIKDCTVSQNVASAGGGIYAVYSDMVISDTLVVANCANIQDGGGIDCSDGSLTISNSIIAYNWLSHDQYQQAGAIKTVRCDLSLTNTAIVKNRAVYGQAGGIYSSDTSLTMTNCTLNGNDSPYYDGGLTYRGSGSFAVVTNTIFWNNAPGFGSEIYIKSGTLTISYSDVDGGQSSVWVESGSTLNWGAGMIDADPLFVDSANNDFHLTWNSPCRDTGDNSAVTELYDFEGDPRIALGTVDMGADEYYYHLYHTGEVIPGSPIDVKVVGYPTAPVVLYLGSGIADPPYSTQHGDFWLNWPPLWQGNIGTVPGDGIKVLSTTVPTGWISGSEHPLQALVGPWGGANASLTNPMVLTVE